MKTIFTTGILAAGLIAASFNSFGQTCTISTTATTPSPGFGTSYTVSTSEGFTGTASPINVFPVNAVNSVTSPGRFYYNTAQTSVYGRVTLTPNGNKNVPVNSYTITVKYGAGAGTTQSCTGSSFTIPNAGATYYFTISGINVPASTNYQVTLSLDLGNPTGTTSTVTLSAFSLNGLEHANGALPVKFSGINAKNEGNGAKLTWDVATELNVSNYEVQRSNDGTNFNSIGSVSASGSASYSFVDSKPLSGKVFYRVKSIDFDGLYSYSPIVSLNAGNASIILKAFPLPAQNQITIQHPSATSTTKISLSTEDGRIIRSIAPSNGSLQTIIDLSSVRSGLYLLRFDNGNGTVETMKIVKQ